MSRPGYLVSTGHTTYASKCLSQVRSGFFDIRDAADSKSDQKSRRPGWNQSHPRRPRPHRPFQEIDPSTGERGKYFP